MIDEAQHLAKMASGRRLLDQLDVIKSIANQTRIVHVLFGTYDLLSFRNLNGQLSRRSLDVHFPRYRAESASERQMFINVLGSFACHMPLPEAPDLAAAWEFLYERSLGCVGILKQWLTRALNSVLRRGGNTIVLKDLEAQALSVLQCEKILSETTDGESRATEPAQTRDALQVRLGLRIGAASNACKTSAPAAPLRTKRRPGMRRPQRDRIEWLSMQPAFDSWDLAPVAIPARSRLHSIEPIGVGTPFVESLTGYMIRLAASHAVRVSDLVEHELRASIPYFHAPAGIPNAINGISEGARKLGLRA